MGGAETMRGPESHETEGGSTLDLGLEGSGSLSPEEGGRRLKELRAQEAELGREDIAKGQALKKVVSQELREAGLRSPKVNKVRGDESYSLEFRDGFNIAFYVLDGVYMVDFGDDDDFDSREFDSEEDTVAFVKTVALDRAGGF